jgi:hypothetical protein
MIWHATDHSRMKSIKDPRVDGDGSETDVAEMKQTDLDFEKPDYTLDDDHA